MKLLHRLALTALLGVPLALFFVARRANQQRPQKLGVHRGCEFLVFSPDGKTLLSSSFILSSPTLQNSNVFWNIQSGQRLRTYNSRELYPQQLVCFSPDGKQMAMIVDGFIKPKNRQLISQTTMSVSTPAGRNLKRFVLPQKRYPNYDEFRDGPIAVRWSSDGKEVIVQGGRDIRRVNPNTGRVSGSSLYKSDHNEWSMDSLSPDGSMVAHTDIKGDKPYAVLTDTHTAQRALISIGHITSWLTFSPRSQFLAVAQGGRIKFMRVRNRKHLWTWSGVSQDSFHFSSDEKSVVTCNGSNCVSRDAQTGRELWRVKNPSSLTFALSPDGKTLAEAKPNGQIFLWPLPQSS